jgi:hypothetical protein
MKISINDTFNLELNTNEDNSTKMYGFSAYRPNGYSMPKGFITSYYAHHYVKSGETHIEYSIQSPTGDSSDHFNYTIPCNSWNQAKWIVDQHFNSVKYMLETYNKIPLEVV